jgi:hypothetical protein
MHLFDRQGLRDSQAVCLGQQFTHGADFGSGRRRRRARTEKVKATVEEMIDRSTNHALTFTAVAEMPSRPDRGRRPPAGHDCRGQPRTRS